jgi:hypothetical protein
MDRSRRSSTSRTQPTGPEIVVKFPFEVEAAEGLNRMAEISGKQWHFLRGLLDGPQVHSVLSGFSPTLYVRFLRHAYSSGS